MVFVSKTLRPYAVCSHPVAILYWSYYLVILFFVIIVEFYRSVMIQK